MTYQEDRLNADTLPAILLTEDLTDGQRDAIKDMTDAKRGELYSIENVDHVIVFHSPTRPQYKRFMGLYEKKDKRDIAQNGLLNDILVYPTVEDFNKLLEEKPGYIETLTTAALKVVGIDPDASGKKF